MTQKAPVTSLSLGIVFLLAALSALIATAIDMNLPAFPAIIADLKVTDAQMQYTLSVFLIGIGIGQGFYGPILDRYGRRMPLIIGTVIFVIGSLIAANTKSFELLLAARFLQGMGAAAGAVVPRAMIRDTSDLASSARLLALLMQITIIAPITAPILGGILLNFGDWHIIFWSMALVGIICIAFSLPYLPETLQPEKRLPLNLKNTFRGYARQCTSPAFMLFTLATCLNLGALFSYIGNAPLVFIKHFGFSEQAFSIIFAGNAFISVSASLLNVRLLKRYQPYRILVLGLVGYIVIAAVSMALSYADLVNRWSYMGLLALNISMLGFISSNLVAMTMSKAGEYIGIASALMGMLQFTLAAGISFIVGKFPLSIAIIPSAMMVCGLLALVFSVMAQRIGPSNS
ncbi:multidrug effflux MFS transporter [Pseudomonas sp. F1_0610]|uniref:multidrug effflux MFS transporter n=1 Tax=Pseudomonas sp. F1_0610 TaxID=3114284 RepID=UPI0039C1115A